MKTTLAFAFVLLLGWAEGQNPPADHLIDLTMTSESTDEEMQTVAVSDRVGAIPPAPTFVVTHGSGSLVVPFELRTLTFDRSDYVLGDPFTYGVTLRYLGSAPFTFPIERKKHLFRHNMAGLREVTLAVEFDDADWKHQIVSIDALYGSSEVPGSLLTLTANQTIQVRGRGRWRLQPGTVSPSPTWSGEVTPFADLELLYSPTRYRSARSAPAASIRLSRSQ